MRTNCPKCDAGYDIPDALIGSGRRVRCAKCAEYWQVMPPAAVAAPASVVAPPSPPEPPPAARPAPAPPSAPQRWMLDPTERPPVSAAPPPRRQVLALRGAWAASIALVAGLVAAGWVYRQEVTAAWPPAARLYLPFDPSLRG